MLAGKEKIFVQFALAYLPVITNSTNIKIFNKMYDNRITQATFNGKHFISLRVSDNVYSYTFNLKVLCYKNEPLYSYMYGNGTLVYLSSKTLCKKTSQTSFYSHVCVPKCLFKFSLSEYPL